MHDTRTGEAADFSPVLIGVPYDASSSFLRGPAAAPDVVRGVLHSGSGNWTTELGLDLDPSRGGWVDGGNLVVPDDASAAFEAIVSGATSQRVQGAPLVAVGGDHSITYPLIAQLSETRQDLTILQVDARPDLYDELDGQRLSHACPFARIMEAGHASRLLQFGIRTMTAHQQGQVDKFGVEVFTAAKWDGIVPPVSGDVYISIDVDGLDPAFAPGVSHHEPGGLSMRQVLDLIHQIADRPNVRLVGADVVEINPERDLHDMTAAVGAKLVKELLGVMVRPQ